MFHLDYIVIFVIRWVSFVRLRNIVISIRVFSIILRVFVIIIYDFIFFRNLFLLLIVRVLFNSFAVSLSVAIISAHTSLIVVLSPSIVWSLL